MAAGTLGIPEVIGIPFVPGLVATLLFGGLVGLTRFRGAVTVVAGGLLGLVLVGSLTPLIRPAAQALIRTDPLPAGGADAIVVLSAAVTRDSLLSPEGAERLLAGVALLRDGAAPTVVTSRVRQLRGHDTVTSDADQARLLALAPDSIRWLVIDSVATTRDEAVRTAALARREGWRQLIVVTSPLHTRRACAAFRKVGLTISCQAAPWRGVAVHSLTTPSERLAVIGPWLYETVGWWWYRVRGWV